MDELKQLLDAILNENLLQIVVSAKRPGKKMAQALLSGQEAEENVRGGAGKAAIQKIKVRPIRQKSALIFQAALWDGKKEFHKNYSAQEMTAALLVWMEQDFCQLQADTTGQSFGVLVSKKGKVTIKTHNCKEQRPMAQLTHNRQKRYLLPEGTPAAFLVKLGVMTKEGRVVRDKYDKFRQINRFLEFIEDICPALESGRELTMVDFGCGKSYLTFAMYYYLHEVKGFDLRIIGLDLKEDVMENCASLAQELGYQKLQFLTGDIADYDGVTQVDLVVTLHACDTATDYALAKAVQWKAKAILSVPCCQHELNQQMRCEALEPVLQYGLLKERMAALITDGLRASILEQMGYRVQVLEFIDMEHTPKNVLLRAVRRDEAVPAKQNQEKEQEGRPEDYADREVRSAPEAAPLQTCMEFLHVRPTLSRLLLEQGQNVPGAFEPGITGAAGAPEKRKR